MRLAILKRGAASAASGLMLAALFPNAGASFLAWVALVPLTLAAGSCRPRAAAAYGYLAGVLFFAVLDEWIRIFDVTAWVAMSLILGLYVALFAACVSLLAPASRGWRRVLAPAAAWTALEWLRGLGPAGFTWGGLGYSLHGSLPLVQLAGVTGPSGLTFLIVAVNAALADALRLATAGKRLVEPGVAAAIVPEGEPPAEPFLHGLGSAGGSPSGIPLGASDGPTAGSEGAHAIAAGGSVRPALVRLLAVAATVAACWAGGAWRMSRPLPSPRPVRVAVLQGSIGGEGDRDLWSLEKVRESARVYLKLTQQAAGAGARIVAWPESAVPGALEAYPDLRGIRDEIAGAARRLKVTIIVGSSHRDAAGRALNSAFLYGPDGRLHGRYDKVHLVPYGEFTPWLRQLGFIYRHFPIIDTEFSPGRGFHPLKTDEGQVGVAICFESAFPEIARALRHAGAGMLLVITNDAWFGTRSATWQHYRMAAFRAVESGAYVARASTSGVTVVLDPYGRIMAKAALSERRMLLSDVALARGDTLYGRIGDVVAWGSALAILALLLGRSRRRRPGMAA